MVNRLEVAEYLKANHKGKKNAARSCVLEERYNVSGRGIRYIINHLRQHGFPICSDESGYYFATSKREVTTTVFRLNGLVAQVSCASAGLSKAKLPPKRTKRNGGKANAK